MRLTAIATLSLTFGLVGCATLERGTLDQVYVETDPPGATATISVSNATCLTPCRFDVNRTDAVTISVTKDGYDNQTIDVKTKSIASDAATSKALTPDYIGRVVDYKDGANLIHTPNPVVVKLVKTKS